MHITRDPKDPSWFRARFEDDARFSVAVTLTVEVDEDEGRAFLQRLVIEAPDARHQITAVDLRSVPPRELVKEALAGWRGDGEVGELETVAEIYQRAADDGRDALMAVARTLGIGRSTAGNRVREARAVGLLPSTPAPHLIRRRRSEPPADTDGVRPVAEVPEPRRVAKRPGSEPSPLD
jgi:hypothetical protein